MKKKLLDGLIKASENKYAGSIDVCEVYKHPYFVDTGNYILNGLISGDIFKGIPAGMIVQWAGDKSTGKSFMTQNILINHIKSDKNNIALLIETEGGLIAEQILANLNADEAERLLVYPCSTIEQIKTELNRIIEYIKSKEEEYKDVKFLLTIDSIGMPASIKEKDDATNDKNTRDMTRAQAVKSLFRTIVMDLSVLHIPVNIINHQYATMDQYSPKEESSGSGMAYANSVTLIMTKKKLKDKDVQVGTVFTITPKKSRIVAENISKIELYSRFKIGMDRYTGLWEFLKNHKLITTVGNGSKGGSTITFVDTGEVFQSKDISKIRPEDFWTQAKLDYINSKFQEFYLLSRAKERSIDDTLQQDDDEEVEAKERKSSDED